MTKSDGIKARMLTVQLIGRKISADKILAKSVRKKNKIKYEER